MYRPLLLLAALCGNSLPASAAAPPVHNLGDIERAVLAWVNDSDLSGGDVEITVGRLDPRLRLARCTQPLATRFTHAQRRSGPTSVEVRCEGEKPWALYVPVTLARYLDVVVTTQPVARGQALAPQDLELARRRVDGGRRDYLQSLDDALGQVARRQFPAGTTVGQNQLQRPQLVRRGEHVILSSGNPAVTVNVKGEALADGGAGDRIRVRNLSSSRVVEGTVNAAGVVVVHSGSML